MNSSVVGVKKLFIPTRLKLSSLIIMSRYLKSHVLVHGVTNNYKWEHTFLQITQLVHKKNAYVFLHLIQD